MKNPPEDLGAALLRLEQMKTNMERHRHNNELLEYVGGTFLQVVPLLRDYGASGLAQDYIRWYIDFRNGRLPL